jgi:anti-sigma B factor antagonist
MLKVTKQDDVGVVTFTTSRILDQSNVQGLGDEFNALLADYKLKKIVLNFSNIGYLSSAVMGKLVNLLKKVQASGGDMRLCNIDSSIFEIFKIMRFDKLFKIRETEDQAVIDLMG